MEGKLTPEEYARLKHEPLPIYGDRAEDYTGPHQFECSKRMCGHCECTCGYARRTPQPQAAAGEPSS